MSIMPLSQLIYKLSDDPVYNCYWYDYGDSLAVCSLDEYYSHLDYDTGTADRLAVITTEGDIALLGDDGTTITPHLLRRVDQLTPEACEVFADAYADAMPDEYDIDGDSEAATPWCAPWTSHPAAEYICRGMTAKEMGARWVEKTVSAWKDAYEATKAEADA